MAAVTLAHGGKYLARGRNVTPVMRRAPALVRATGFEAVRFCSYEFAGGAYMLSVIDRGADILSASGRIGSDLTAALKAEARRRVEAGTFFGHIAYGIRESDRSQVAVAKPPALSRAAIAQHPTSAHAPEARRTKRGSNSGAASRAPAGDRARLRQHARRLLDSSAHRRDVAASSASNDRHQIKRTPAHTVTGRRVSRERLRRRRRAGVPQCRWQPRPTSAQRRAASSCSSAPPRQSLLWLLNTRRWCGPVQ